jgi:hypothetical protein
MRWVWLAPTGAGVYCVIRLWPTFSEEYWPLAPVLLLVAAILAGLVSGVILLGALVIRRRRPGRVLVAFALAAGLQAATPYYVGWESCNEHGGNIATIFIPYVLIAQPEYSIAPYDDAHTDMECVTQPAE